MKSKIENVLISLGFNPSLKGFVYLVYVVNYLFDCHHTPSEVSITNDLYKAASFKFYVKPPAIERCIRSSIKSAQLTDNKGLLMTNSNCVGYIYYLVKNQEEKK